MCYVFQPTATMKDVILAIRADEAHHRVVNHTLASMNKDDFNPYKPGEQTSGKWDTGRTNLSFYLRQTPIVRKYLSISSVISIPVVVCFYADQAVVRAGIISFVSWCMSHRYRRLPYFDFQLLNTHCYVSIFRKLTVSWQYGQSKEVNCVYFLHFIYVGIYIYIYIYIYHLYVFI